MIDGIRSRASISPIQSRNGFHNKSSHVSLPTIDTQRLKTTIEKKAEKAKADLNK